MNPLKPESPDPQQRVGAGRNSAVLTEFAEYCRAHPQERFWQALRNWSNYHYLIVSNLAPGEKGFARHWQDTFPWEGRKS